jgi:uncharacterized protein YciI
MANVRNTFVGILLTGLCSGMAAASPAQTGPVDALASVDHTQPMYLVVYRRGSAWEDAKPMGEQAGMREHFRYYLDLHRRGQLVAAGGFMDDSGGAAVIRAADDAAAAAILAQDPAVKGHVFRFELQRWKPNAWEEISQRAAARGE